MKCPVCGKEIRFEDGVYCSPECAQVDEKELEALLGKYSESDIEKLLQMLDEESRDNLEGEKQ